MSPAYSDGRCLCGAVTLRVSPLKKNVGICHCGMCRKWVGGPFFSIECHGDIQITGDEYVGVYSSSEWAERVFCKKCGSALMYRLKADGLAAVSAGLFDHKHFRLSQQIFIDEKPDYYEFSNDTPRLTGDEVFAAFAAKDDVAS